jgi:hypothetical protein
MAAFTTMAIIGLSAYAGAQTAKSIVEKKRANAAKKLVTAPAPTAPTAPTLATESPMIAPPAPPDPLRAQSETLRGAQRAGKRQQQRAMAPSGTLLGGATRTAGTAVAATKPKTLLGY